MNLGCGSRYHSDWVNVNFTSTGPGVIAANLNEGIPFPDESFDVVYHSHLLEHFTKSTAGDFLKECHRVLKPSGIIRVVVPDLEGIVRGYLIALEKSRAGIEGWKHNYDWMMLEMYDQVSRNQSGGEMARYLRSDKLANEQFVTGRCGTEVRNIIAEGRKHISREFIQSYSCKMKRVLGQGRPRRWKEILLQMFLGKEFEALQTGRFRLSGEIHQWMYDSYSLGRLLQECGFSEVSVLSAAESQIPNWTDYNLDTEKDGSVYKPDSLYIEATKP